MQGHHPFDGSVLLLLRVDCLLGKGTQAPLGLSQPCPDLFLFPSALYFRKANILWMHAFISSGAVILDDLILSLIRLRIFVLPLLGGSFAAAFFGWPFVACLPMIKKIDQIQQIQT